MTNEGSKVKVEGLKQQGGFDYFECTDKKHIESFKTIFHGIGKALRRCAMLVATGKARGKKSY